MNKQDALSKVDELLKPYLYLDKTKTDGKDMRFKFANMGLGVAPDTIKFLRSLGQKCKSWQLSTEERLKITDALVLYSNHLDQHTDASQNPKLDEQTKNLLVFNLLHDAYSLFSTAPKRTTVQARELSTYAQLLHYYGKALRYNKIPVENRLEFLQEATRISAYLDEKMLEETVDPHQFKPRTMSYELPIIYSYQDLGRFQDALAITLRHISTAPNNFHKIQAQVQTAQTYRKQQEPAKGIEYAKAALDLSISDKSNLLYNAKQALMECYWDAGFKDEAIAQAIGIIESYEKNANCGAKDSHLKAANTIIQEVNMALTNAK